MKKSVKHSIRVSMLALSAILLCSAPVIADDTGTQGVHINITYSDDISPRAGDDILILVSDDTGHEESIQFDPSAYTETGYDHTLEEGYYTVVSLSYIGENDEIRSEGLCCSSDFSVGGIDNFNTLDLAIGRNACILLVAECDSYLLVKDNLETSLNDYLYGEYTAESSTDSSGTCSDSAEEASLNERQLHIEESSSEENGTELQNDQEESSAESSSGTGTSDNSEDNDEESSDKNGGRHYSILQLVQKEFTIIAAAVAVIILLIKGKIDGTL